MFLITYYILVKAIGIKNTSQNIRDFILEYQKNLIGLGSQILAGTGKVGTRLLTY